MRSYVINLDRNPERLTAAGERFAARGIPFDRFVGVDATAMSDDDVAEFRQCRPSMPWTHLGQIGCFLSHLAVWRLIADGVDACAAVFEDDVHLSEDLANFLDEAAAPGGPDVVRLEASTNRVLLRPFAGQAQTEVAWNGRVLRHVRSTTWCTGGYIISRSAAALLASLPESAHQPVDWMLFCFESSSVARGLTIAQVVPALCIQDKYLHTDPGSVALASEIEVGAPASPWTDRLTFYARNALPAVWKTVSGYERVRFEPAVGAEAKPGVRSRGLRIRLGGAVTGR